MQEFRALCKDLSKRMIRARFFSQAVERTATTGILILQVVLLAGGAYLVTKGIMSIDELVVFQGLFVGLSASMTELTRYFPTLLEAGAGADRIEELLEEKPQVVDRPDAIDCPPIRQGLEFKNVSFGYDPTHNNLDKVSFDVPRGSLVAIVGASGSGKSTAMKLLSRFYDPDAGMVTIDGVDIRTITQDSLRARMTYVFQDSYLFNVSVRENIRMGRMGASDEDVEVAAKRAEIDEYIRTLPQGYDTGVGERGLNLSSGQRQRIAIARALMRDAEILALDEATSALDPGTESAINHTISRIGKGRTVVSITHRLSTVSTYDKIIVMSGGRMVEAGKHDELLARGGQYAQLWRKQSGFEVSDDGEYAAVTVDRLRSIPIFEELSDDLLVDIAGHVITELTPSGRHVVYEGDFGDLLYIIVRGSVEVAKNGQDGVPRRVAVLQDGDHFGEVALLHPVPRTASVRTLTPCIFLTLKRTRFLRLLERAPQLRASLEQIYYERIQDELRSVK
jgi:ATP-binding cassette subfamily B protein